MSEERLWKVRVNCYYKTRSLQKVPKCKIRWFLVYATQDTVYEVAVEFAQKTWTLGPLLTGIEATAAFTATIPYELKD